MADSLKSEETAASIKSRNDDFFSFEMIEGRFSCLFSCPHCKETVAVAGTYWVQDDRIYDQEYGEAGEILEYYRPRYFSEAPPLIQLPDKTPDTVREEITKAFQLFWLDEEACGNRIRSAVEQLLTINGIPKTELVKKGASQKRNLLSLHRRIERFKKKRPELAEQLFAIKWIGNAGSHASGLNIEDLKDGFLLLELVLKELYDSSRRNALRIAKAVNKRKKPRSAYKSRK